ncbi:MAG: hypothetical protein [Microviridae sp.]|nr:MAG: hypothetical protein [Microviridae sp.]
MAMKALLRGPLVFRLCSRICTVTRCLVVILTVCTPLTNRMEVRKVRFRRRRSFGRRRTGYRGVRRVIRRRGRAGRMRIGYRV